MDKFLYFLRSHTNFLVFVALEVLCVILIVQGNGYHRSAWLSTANAVSGGWQSATSGVSHYFSLSSANEALARQNAELMETIEGLRGQLAAVEDSATLATIDSLARADSRQYRIHQARVVGASTHRSRNMLTLDRGSLDGVGPDMAVIDPRGVVGLVCAVSDHYALVLPIINTSSHLSVKVQRSGHRGQLIWDGVTPREAQVVDIPEHAAVAAADTIVTSGASSFFPAGLMVGTVAAVEPDRNGGFLNIDVALSVDFNAVYEVQVLEDLHMAERHALEATNDDDDE